MTVRKHDASEQYRGVNITIEENDYPDVGHFAAHVPTPGHGYLDAYFDTAEQALAAARTEVDERLPRENPYIAAGWNGRMLPPEGARVQWRDSRGDLRTGTVQSGYATVAVVIDTNGAPGALTTVDVTALEPKEAT